MNRSVFTFFLIITLLFAIKAMSVKLGIEPSKALQAIEEQLKKSLTTHTEKTRFPRSTKPDGSLSTVTSDDWVSGFYPGSLWYMYDYTKDPKWEKAAREWTANLEKEKFNATTHDLGFMLYCSFGNGYRLTKDPAYKEIMLEGARSLSKRFNPKAGTIRSWDFGKWQYPVIIDNMMNLEFLFWATKASGDSSFYKIAVTHANTTMKHHFRKDYSSYHVIDYDTVTGNVLSKGTHQGCADESSWARGQAWGLYGFLTCYRETKDIRYLNFAEKIANFILNNPSTPSDKIPYWDYNAPNITTQERDASAAAITASAMLELYTYTKDKTYLSYAEQILKSLSLPAYFAELGTNNHFILKHCVGNKPAKSEIDAPLAYGDYYYIEALIRYSRLNVK